MTADRWIRATKGLTQNQKAIRAGVSFHTIKRWDRLAKLGKEVVGVPEGKMKARLVAVRNEGRSDEFDVLADNVLNHSADPLGIFFDPPKSGALIDVLDHAIAKMDAWTEHKRRIREKIDQAPSRGFEPKIDEEARRRMTPAELTRETSRQRFQFERMK